MRLLHIGGKHCSLRQSVVDLKKRVIAKGLPSDDKKVPNAKPVKILANYVEFKNGMASFRLPLCKRNYKRY